MNTFINYCIKQKCTDALKQMVLVHFNKMSFLSQIIFFTRSNRSEIFWKLHTKCNQTKDARKTKLLFPTSKTNVLSLISVPIPPAPSPCQHWAGTYAASWSCTAPASAHGSAQTPTRSQTSWRGWPASCSGWPRRWESWRSGRSPPSGSCHHTASLPQTSCPGMRQEAMNTEWCNQQAISWLCLNI